VTFFSRWLEAEGREATLDGRDEALIRFLLGCGVRVSEACGLRVDQLDLDQDMAIVKGKGSKVRPVYFGARTARALDRYVRVRAHHRWAHLDALFLTQGAPCHRMVPGIASKSEAKWPE
jgi:site-specific recombinase XerD